MAATCPNMFCSGPPAPHNGIKNGVPQTRPRQAGRGGTGKKTEGIRVEIELTQEHHRGHGIRRRVSITVTGFLEEEEFYDCKI